MALDANGCINSCPVMPPCYNEFSLHKPFIENNDSEGAEENLNNLSGCYGNAELLDLPVCMSIQAQNSPLDPLPSYQTAGLVEQAFMEQDGSSRSPAYSEG